MSEMLSVEVPTISNNSLVLAASLSYLSILVFPNSPGDAHNELVTMLRMNFRRTPIIYHSKFSFHMARVWCYIWTL